MGFRQNFFNAAQRHLRAADELLGTASAGSQPGCRAVAGYLYGLSGELAVKEMMRESGMRPLALDSRGDDPFYAHFPHLKSRLLDAVQGRRSGELRKVAQTSALFQHWHIDMRYAPTTDVAHTWVESWKASAHDLVSRMVSP